MSDKTNPNNLLHEAPAPGNSETQQYSLNDDRRVKVLSPGAMVTKRFFRNRIAVVGLAILTFMFLFSFLGGLITPYEEDQQFYRVEYQNKEYAGVVKNEDFRFAAAAGQKFDSVLQAQTLLAIQKNTPKFSYRNERYMLATEGEDFYRVAQGPNTLGIAYKDIVTSSIEGQTIPYELQFGILKAHTNGETSFSLDGKDYLIDEDGGVFCGDEEVAFISRYVVQPVQSDIFLTRAFQEELITELEGDGFTMIPFGQGFKDMSPGTKELEKLLLEGKMIHGGNPVLQWMAGNVVIEIDSASNYKPSKRKSTEKIDGIVAWIMGLDRAIRHQDHGSVYDERGLISF